MKRYIKSIYALAVAAIMVPALTSCEGEQATPPMPLPEELFIQTGQNTDENAPNYNPNIGKIGQGTWECPLTVWQARIGTKPAGMTDNVWVCGYIVGWVNTGVSLVMQESSCVFEAPASTSGNILISDYSPEELKERFIEKEYDLDQDGNPTGTYKVISDTRWEHCCPVDLVYDTDPRAALGLTSANASNLGKIVSVMGETALKKYGIFGVKLTSAYNWGVQGKYIPPAVPGLFEKVETFTPDNWYVIAAKQDNTWYAGRSTEASRTYLPKTTVSVSDGRIDLANVNNNAFYFEAAEEGAVRIKMHNDLYLCIDGTDIAFHTTATPDRNCLFTVAPRGDGTFLIKSKVNGNTMLFDTGYGSYGLYSNITADHVYPSLFIQLQ